MTTVQLYIALFCVTSLYAAILARVKHLWEPDLTWLEVVIGVFLCLLAPALDSRAGRVPDAATYETRVWWAFIVGGAPIILWQIGKTVNALRKIEKRNSRNGANVSTTLAEEPRGEATTND